MLTNELDAVIDLRCGGVVAVCQHAQVVIDVACKWKHAKWPAYKLMKYTNTTAHENANHKATFSASETNAIQRLHFMSKLYIAHLLFLFQEPKRTHTSKDVLARV